MPSKRKRKRRQPDFPQKEQSASPLIGGIARLSFIVDGIARLSFIVISLWCINAGVHFVRGSVDPQGDWIDFVIGIVVILISLYFMLWIIRGVRGNQAAPSWGDVIGRILFIVLGLFWFYLGLVIVSSFDGFFAVVGIVIILLSLHFMLAVMGWVRDKFWIKYVHYIIPY